MRSSFASMPAEIGHWIGDRNVSCCYEDKYGQQWLGPYAIAIAARELEEYNALRERRRLRAEAIRFQEMDGLAGRPVSNDYLLEQPESLDPISMMDVWVSNDRAHWRPWRDGPYWIPMDWQDIPSSARRMAVVKEHMWRVAFRRRSDRSIVWTKPLGSYELSEKERSAAVQTITDGLDPTAIGTCPWVSSFSKDHTKWLDPEKGTYVSVRWALKRVRVVCSDFWRVVFQYAGRPDQRANSMVSLAMNWADLTNAEQVCFQRQPLDMKAFPDRR